MKSLLLPALALLFLRESWSQVICPDGSRPQRTCTTDDYCATNYQCVDQSICCPTCGKARTDALASGNRQRGEYIPKCADFGNERDYEPLQYEGRTGQSWCVARDGREIPGTRSDDSAQLNCLNERNRFENSGRQPVCSITRGGTCPFLSFQPPASAFNACDCDNDCQGSLNHKCCATSNGRRCIDPNSRVITANRNKEGFCPPPPPPPVDSRFLTIDHRCDVDTDCEGALKCCQGLRGRDCTNPSSGSVTLNSNDRCKADEEYVECLPTCPASCLNPNPTCLRQDSCSPGCTCRSGYVHQSQNPRSKCVLRTECSRQITAESCRSDPLKEFRECGNPCPDGCFSRISGSLERGQIKDCTRCERGCFCRPGYIFKFPETWTSSPCVPRSSCPSFTTPPPSGNGIGGSTTTRTQCRYPNQVYRSCGSACPTGCDQRNPQICTANCVEGCFCQPGYIFESAINWRSSRCIRETSCPTPVDSCNDPTKSFNSCGTACPEGCDAGPATSCSRQCVQGCFCNPGYIFESVANWRSARCVRPQNCPVATTPAPSCGDIRKEYKTCGSQCPSGCGQLNRACVLRCTTGCYCRSGYVFEDPDTWRTSRCILASSCPVATQPPLACSDPRKEYLNCGSPCPGGCGNLNPSCISRCTTGCFCRLGYTFEDPDNWRTSRCIRSSECPNTAISTITQVKPGFCPSRNSEFAQKTCNSDGDCPSVQKCCSDRNSFRRVCMCPKENTRLWRTCKQTCGSTQRCTPGNTYEDCHCDSGYVLENSFSNAQCVRSTQCSFINTGGFPAPRPNPLPPLPPLPTQTQAPPIVDRSLDESQAVVNVASDLIAPGQFNRVTGRLTMSQAFGAIRLSGSLNGLDPGAHAIKIHENGDCSRPGGLYNPDSSFRSGFGRDGLGDLGDVTTPIVGDTQVNIRDSEISFSGARSVIGRALAVYQSGRNDKFGNSPIACGVIGITTSNFFG